MKKVIMILCALVFCALLVGCSCESETEHTHIWDSGKVVKESTVSEYGTRVYTCIGCGATNSTMIPKLEHRHIYDGEWVTNRMAHWHACGVENCTILGDKDFHVWDEGVIIADADQTTTGKKLYTCDTCGYKKEEDYRASATVDANGWSSAMNSESFENVTFYYTVKESGVTTEALAVEIANGKVKYTEDNYISYDLDVVGARLGSVALSALLEGYKNEFESFKYDSLTRSYLYDGEEEKVAIQFSDGNICYVSITRGQSVTVLNLSKHGRTEVGAR